jgi:hypothetical protein
MPRRSLAQSSFFDPEFVLPKCLEPGTVPWLLARFRSRLFPSWLFKGWRGEARVGRKAWPPVVLMTLLLLRWSEEGMSRVGSTRRAATDARWRAAMGLCFGTDTPDEKTLREFEAFLGQRDPSCGVSRLVLLHEHVVRLCLQAGLVDGRAVWAMDSTPMWCYGAVLDTIRLMGDGTRALAQCWARASGLSLETVAGQWGLPYLPAKSTKGHFRIDWRDLNQRAEVVDTLAQGVIVAVEHVRRAIQTVAAGRRARLLRRCATLLRVVRDDLETDEQGRLVIAQHVAKDRIISLTDPQARHGHKTDRDTFEGFKLHLIGDVVSGLITALTVTRGNVFDGKVAHRLVRRAKYLHDHLTAVLGDTAYGGTALRMRLRDELGVKLIAPPPPNTHRREDRRGRASVVIDFDARTATCAAGITTDDCRQIWSSAYRCYVDHYRWPKAACNACPQASTCKGKSNAALSVRLHPHEKELRQAREEWSQPAVREIYRTRSQCERLIHRAVRHGARRARAWGLAPAHLQAHLIVLVANLKLLARALAAASAG